jgi:hypothetical protein
MSLGFMVGGSKKTACQVFLSMTRKNEMVVDCSMLALRRGDNRSRDDEAVRSATVSKIIVAGQSDHRRFAGLLLAYLPSIWG